MLAFDKVANKLVQRAGGYYARYSDDILIILPTKLYGMIKTINQLERALNKYAPNMKFNGKKTEIGYFEQLSDRQSYYPLLGARDGLAYLGFRYDGRKVYIRNSTISNLQRSIAKACNRYVSAVAKRYPTADKKGLLRSIPIGRVMEATGKVQNFESVAEKYRNWTFWTYASRAHKKFKSFGSGIEKQLNKQKAITRSKLEKRIDKALRDRNNPFFGSTKKKK